MPRLHELAKRILDQMAYMINSNPYAISLSPWPHSRFLTIGNARRERRITYAGLPCVPLIPYPYAMLTTLDAPYPYAMLTTLDASTPYDMLVTLYFSSLPYLYAKSPISVCHYVRKLLSFMAFCHWKIFKTLKIYENGFYARARFSPPLFLGKNKSG